MTNKTFVQITALLFLAAALFYLVCPKYTGYRVYYRYNAITGQTDHFDTDLGKWVSLEKIHKRPSLNEIFGEDDAVKAEEK